MQYTQKKHWSNGYQVRGGWFKTYTFRIFNLGIMVSNGKTKIDFFILK